MKKIGIYLTDKEKESLENKALKWFRKCIEEKSFEACEANSIHHVIAKYLDTLVGNFSKEELKELIKNNIQKPKLITTHISEENNKKLDEVAKELKDLKVKKNDIIKILLNKNNL